jgi:hypothetical protein
MSDHESHSQNSDKNSTNENSTNANSTNANLTTVEAGDIIQTIQSIDTNHNVTTNTTFVTTDPLSDIQITENLEQIVTVYDDEHLNPNQTLINEISLYASQIKCESFHGKGSIDDYNNLFTAASKIATESHQMSLDIDVDGFNEFGAAADELSKLFTSFTIRLQNINIINDTSFLQAVASSLQKIVNLSNVFGKFKETILATACIQIPKSAHDTSVLLQSVSSELNCAMGYISYFVDSNAEKPHDSDLSTEEQQIISSAIKTIDDYNNLCVNGVSVALENNSDIKYINQVNTDLKTKTAALNSAVSMLTAKFAQLSNIAATV